MHYLRIACLLLIQEFWKHFVIAEFTATIPTSSDRPDDEYLDLVSINGRDFRSNITKDISGKPWHDDRKERFITRCVRPTKCEKILNGSCFGTKIPYKFTSVELTDLGSQENSVRKLNQLETLRNVPKCWAVIQPFLCAVYLPKCTRSKSKEYVYLPSYEMCRVTAKPCRILYNTDFFPSYLKCNEEVFPCRNCSNDVRDMKFTSIPSQCMPPLVATDSTINHYPDVEGCGLQCKDPMYTDEEHESVQTLIFWGAIICFICNFFVIATFLIHDWKQSKHIHPAWNLFYISICFLCNWVGWMLQFVPGHRENIVCRRDGTLRYSEPSAGENLACIIPFILIYYFLIAANVWFAIFTYAWYLQTKDRGSIRDRIDKESFYFHFIAWALPFILTVTIMVLSEVDGNSITGICFVGYRNRAIRNGLVLVPVAILSFGVSVFFSFKGAFNLNRIKRSTSSNDESKKLSSHILGMGIRTMLVIFFIFAFFMFESYEVRNAELWAKSLNDFIICKIKESYSGDSSKCKIHNHPSVAVLQLRLLCLFCVNLVILSWCWTKNALKTWKGFLKKKIGYEQSEDEKLAKPKHRIIADGYGQRGDEVVSVSVGNSHTDPAGINFDMNNLNSGESDGMGITNYLCNIINRRNAGTLTQMDFTEPTTNCGAPYASSCADNNSEISMSFRHVSVESRRNSVDSQVSQMSVKMSETNIKATLESHSKQHKSVNMKKRQRNILYVRRTNHRRRASSSSVESQCMTNQLQNIRYKHPIANTMGRQIERRSAITATTTADIADIQQMFSQNDQMQHTSDDDDDQSIDELQHPSNVLVPLGDHQRQMADSVDSLDVSNDKQAAIEQMLKNILKNSTEKQIEALLNTCDRNGLNGIGKSGRSSTRNGRYQRHSHNKIYAPNIDDVEHVDVASSISSSLDVDCIRRLDGTQSSFSDQSISRMKTQSQSSKGSCDVGIQANDYDIASHTRQRSREDCPQNYQYDDDDDAKDNLPEKFQSNYHQHQDDETNQLLPYRKCDAPTIVRKDALSGKHLSESEKMEKLKKLLLPST